MILVISRVTVSTVITISFFIDFPNYCFFNASRCIYNTLILRNGTTMSWYFDWLDCYNITPWTLCRSYPKNYEVTPQATKPKTFVDGKEYFWYHRWLLPPHISSLLQLNSLLSRGSFSRLNSYIQSKIYQGFHATIYQTIHQTRSW